MASKSASFIDFFAKDYRRAIVIGVVLIVITILLFIFWGRIKALVQQIKNRFANEQALNQWTITTGEVSLLPSSQLTILANRLEQAAKGAGTDEDAIYAVFNQMNNTADVYALIAAYGTRDGQDLPTMIRSELTDMWPYREISKVNQILTNKGISYQF